MRAVADELASAAELVKGKADGVPAALVRGAGHLVLAEDGPGAAGLVRFDEADWFATGTVESVRAALGCPPGTPGIEPAPAVPDGDTAAVLARAAAVVSAGAAAEPDLAGAHASATGLTVLVTGPALPAARVAERVVVACRAEGVRTRVRTDAAGLVVHVQAVAPTG